VVDAFSRRVAADNLVGFARDDERAPREVDAVSRSTPAYGVP
jgi:hypothetical protein